MKIGNFIRKIKKNIVGILVIALAFNNFSTLYVQADTDKTFVFTNASKESLGSLSSIAVLAKDYIGTTHIEGHVVIENLIGTLEISPKETGKSIIVNPLNSLNQCGTRDNKPASLVVVGDYNIITYPSSNQVKVNNSNPSETSKVDFVLMKDANNAFDYTAAANGLKTYSDNLYTYPAGEYNDGKTIVLDYTSSNFAGDISMDSSIWNDLLSKYDSVIVNVRASGTVNITMRGNTNWDPRAAKILWNFGTTVNEIKLGDLFFGTIVAPEATLQNTSNINGAIYVKTFKQQGEVHQINFVGKIPVPTVTETPVPTVTETPVPTVTETPVPTVTETPVPTVTETPVPTVTETPVPTVTETPVPTVTETPVPTTVPTLTTAPALTTASVGEVLGAKRITEAPVALSAGDVLGATRRVKTGDYSTMWIALFAISAVGLFGFVIKAKKKEITKENEEN